MDGDCSLGLEAGGLEVIGLSMGHGLQSHGTPRLGVASPTLPRRAREPGLLDDGLTRWKEGPAEQGSSGPQAEATAGSS